MSVGLERFDVIAIIGFNAPEWMFSNFGCIAAGGIPQPVCTQPTKKMPASTF